MEFCFIGGFGSENMGKGDILIRFEVPSVVRTGFSRKKLFCFDIDVLGKTIENLGKQRVSYDLPREF